MDTIVTPFPWRRALLHLARTPTEDLLIALEKDFGRWKAAGAAGPRGVADRSQGHGRYRPILLVPTNPRDTSVTPTWLSSFARDAEREAAARDAVRDGRLEPLCWPTQTLRALGIPGGDLLPVLGLLHDLEQALWWALAGDVDSLFALKGRLRGVIRRVQLRRPTGSTPEVEAVRRWVDTTEPVRSLPILGFVRDEVLPQLQLVIDSIRSDTSGTRDDPSEFTAPRRGGAHAPLKHVASTVLALHSVLSTTSVKTPAALTARVLEWLAADGAIRLPLKGAPFARRPPWVHARKHLEPRPGLWPPLQPPYIYVRCPDEPKRCVLDDGYPWLPPVRCPRRREAFSDLFATVSSGEGCRFRVVRGLPGILVPSPDGQQQAAQLPRRRQRPTGAPKSEQS